VKGFSIGLLVEVLCAALAGGKLGLQQGSFTDNDGQPIDNGQFFIAIDPQGFSGGGFDATIQQLMQIPPEMIQVWEPVLNEIGKLQGVRNTQDLLEEVKKRLDVARQQQLQAAQASMGADPNGDMEGTDPSNASQNEGSDS
jgi:hypothetical protein